MNDITVNPLNKPLSGEIIIPSDKSISHRALILGSLTGGVVNISNFSKGKDCICTLNILKQLGVDIVFKDEKNLTLNSKSGYKKPDTGLDCGNSGTSMRLLSGLLSGQNFSSTLIGDASLSKRPMRRIIEPLSLMGAKINSNDNRAPLNIKGQKLKGITFDTKIPSAQVKSSLLIAGYFASGMTAVVEPYLSRNHSELMLKYFDADIDYGIMSDIKALELASSVSCGFYTTIRNSFLVPKDIYVPGDISSAAFFIVGASIIEGSDILIKNVGLNPTRTGIIDVLNMMGGNIEILDLKTKNNELIGDIRVKYSPNLKGCTIEGDIIPRLIDEIPVIAVLSLFAEGKTVIKDAKDLKNKESNRIDCTSLELKKLGANIVPTDDGFIIEGKNKLKGGVELNCYNDHRIAMSLYVASLLSSKTNLIKDFGWVDTSFPEFGELFGKLIGE